uniref:L1 transposable element RRM domain-containing protein n=1 Tax=Oryzias melastigma TaxID=30732 RepID=A0A3B3DS65_ORYME
MGPKKSSAESTLQQTLLKTNANASANAPSASASSWPTEGTASTSMDSVMQLLHKLGEDQTKILEELKKNFDEIRKQLTETNTVVSTFEGKMSDMLTRLHSAESRLDALEDSERQQCDTPSATVEDITTLNTKLAQFEDRERRLNLRIYGFPKKAKGKDVIGFLQKVLPEILQHEFEGPLEIEHAHRSLAQVKPGDPHRALVVRFLRFPVKEQVQRLAREKGAVHWREHRISFCQDFSKATQVRRQAFQECRRLLHQAKILFGIGYPAVLSFTPQTGLKYTTKKGDCVSFFTKKKC